MLLMRDSEITDQDLIRVASGDSYMTRDASQPILTVVLVDYDNIYLALKKRSEEAAKRFAKDAVGWIREIESGRLLSATNSPGIDQPRRIVVNRCYGNPVPRRNQHDNSTDMTSFPFVRHHFLRAGFEVVDCPPLTAQLKNSSDIKMVMDANDLLSHATHFDEFVILSGDADFTPLLHRLRAHNRRSVIYANDFTAAAYKSICDSEIKESTFMSVLLEAILQGETAPLNPPQTASPARTPSVAAAPTAPAELSISPERRKSEPQPQVQAQPQAQPQAQIEPQPLVRANPGGELPSLERLRGEIIAAVVVAVKGAGGPVPLEALAERTTRALGHDRTIGTSWAGSGGFLELLRRYLPLEIGLTEQPPYLAFDASRVLAAPVQQPMPLIETRQPERIVERGATQHAVPAQAPAVHSPPMQAPVSQPVLQPTSRSAPALPPVSRNLPPVAPSPAAIVPAPAIAQKSQSELATAIQASIARIHEACQAPPLSPPDYRALFEIIAQEITENSLQGAQTMTNLHARTQQHGLAVTRDDIRFIMEVVSEDDPWFEQGVSAVLFAGRFRNFVVARCRSQGLQLSGDELDLIDAWFAGAGQQVSPQSIRQPVQAPAQAASQAPAQPQYAPQQQASSGPLSGQLSEGGDDGEQFPKILRTRLRG